MPAKYISCGPTANHSEALAIERCKAVFGAEWILLSNVQLITGQDYQPSEIDLIAIGPPGIMVIEVKHWDGAWVSDNQDSVEDEARKLKSKTERVGSLLRRELPGLDIHAEQCFLFTREGSQSLPQKIAGAPVWTLRAVPAEIAKLTHKILDADQVNRAAAVIQPRARLQTDGKLRNAGDYKNMELQSSTEDKFHRIYKAQHRRTGEKVILHLYDLSDTQDKDPRRLAEREFRVLQELQKCRYVPRTRDSFQDLPGFPGEVCLFSIFDPLAPSLEKRAGDKSWSLQERLDFAIAAADALSEIHGASDSHDAQIVHRNISPQTILVGAKNRPIFTGFDVARADFTKTLPPTKLPAACPGWIAPELVGKDLSLASVHSDVFALCASLRLLFDDQTEVHTALELGLVAEPSARIVAEALMAKLEHLKSPEPKKLTEPPALPRSEFWCEGTEIPFRGMMLEVLGSLGAGGIGRTFKVAGMNPETGESYGTYVAKVIYSRDTGLHALAGYRRARAHSLHPSLATVHEIAEDWEADGIMALLQWVEREPLSGLRDGLAGLAVQECSLNSLAELTASWLQDGCAALAALHSQGLVHGDVSPRNLIYRPGQLCLTDYDLVTQVGTAAWTAGARPFSSPEAEQGQPLGGSDDVFALAASLFSVLFDTDTPFRQSNGAQNKKGGLCWTEEGRESLGHLSGFFDKATNAARDQRFRDGSDALLWLKAHAALDVELDAASTSTDSPPAAVAQSEVVPEKTPGHVRWLDSLLSVYPGSPRGNIETRGLDSDFAAATYVPTALEEELVEDIRARRLRLLILCGNAGDGKTALLQRIAREFGQADVTSERRVWEYQSSEGMLLKANLDGSAAWGEFSADQLLDDILLPFLEGSPREDRVHLLAINDGRLLQWLDDRRAAGMQGELLESLMAFLSHEDDAELPEHLRFISLNHRSLVGGRTGDGNENAKFVDDQITALIGGDVAAQTWQPCLACTAWDRCHAGPMAHLLMDRDSPRAARVRQRLHGCLQAIHQRGNVHITARELRGVLSYLLFGVHSCDELHNTPDLNFRQPGSLRGIGDMAFNPESPFRQGELLKELAELDPALEAHCDLDRHLISREAGTLGCTQGTDAARALLASARREAYFYETEGDLRAAAGSETALTLAGGRYLAEFRKASLSSAADNMELCGRLVRGISQLEDLPPLALSRLGKVALRLPSRTPTETRFWVELELTRFRLEPDLPVNLDKAVPRLARQLRLTFSRKEDAPEESLLMGYQLFATLLLLESGEQLADTRSDDLFANLQIFTQRLPQESSRSLYAWNPKEDDKVFSLSLQPRGDHQSLVIHPEPDVPIP